jgi:hypothetical protein
MDDKWGTPILGNFHILRYHGLCTFLGPGSGVSISSQRRFKPMTMGYIIIHLMTGQTEETKLSPHT